MAKYIDRFPKPFLEDIVHGRCVPFVGAGFSKNANYPAGKTMPLWDDLGKALAGTIEEYEYASAIDALSAYEHEYSRPKLIEALHELLLVDSAQVGDTHRAFCDLPFGLCVTTNFEFLLEKGYDSVDRYCRPIVDEDQLSIDSTTAEIKLLKFHGDLHHPNRMIATENDYDSFLDKYPMLATYLANLLIVKTAFFIGYSLEDPDFRNIWQLVGNRLGKLRRQAYTVLVSASNPTIARFERRGVKVINLPGRPENYQQILADAFRELKEYWSETLLEQSTTTEDDALAQLVIPKTEVNRLCFFSVPSKQAAFYRLHVYPIAERCGFVPIMAVDVIAPGDNLTAKISALIDRCEIILVDSSSPNTEIEKSIALAKAKSRVLVLHGEDYPVLIDTQSVNYIFRPLEGDVSLDDFLFSIEQWFSLQSEELGNTFNNEPQRLLRKKEYRSAIISAASLNKDRSGKAGGIQCEPLKAAARSLRGLAVSH